MKKYKFTRNAINLIKKSIIDKGDEKAVSFSDGIIMDDCKIGEESIIISVFSNSLDNKKYFKEIK